MRIYAVSTAAVGLMLLFDCISLILKRFAPSGSCIYATYIYTLSNTTSRKYIIHIYAVRTAGAIFLDTFFTCVKKGNHRHSVNVGRKPPLRLRRRSMPYGIDLGNTLEGSTHGDSPDGGGIPRAPSWCQSITPPDTASGVRRCFIVLEFLLVGSRFVAPPLRQHKPPLGKGTQVRRRGSYVHSGVRSGMSQSDGAVQLKNPYTAQYK